MQCTKRASLRARPRYTALWRDWPTRAGSFYQYIDNDSHCDSHLHLMCRECGALYHVDCQLVGTLIRHIQEDHGFTLDARRTMLVGICGECTERMKEEVHGADKG